MLPNQNTRLAVLFHRIGPMHDARLLSAAQLGDVVAIEFTRVDKTYLWDTIDDVVGYQRLTVFPTQDSHTIPSRRVRQGVFEALDEVAPDVVAVPGWSDPGALAALDWCLQNDRRAVIMSDSTAYDRPRTWWKETVKSRIVRTCSTALVGGVPHIEYAIQLGVPRDHIFTKYDVVDNKYFYEAAKQVKASHAEWRNKLRLSRPFFLASCRFIEKKNIFRLLEAYAAYVEESETMPRDLVLLGDGPLRDKVQQEIIELDLLDKIVTPGFIQYGELPSYYGLADAFIHASTTEQWGLVVNEAMASGLPVLVSNRCGCAQDLVQDGLNGFKFDPYDVSSLTKLMFKLSDPNVNLTRMGARSLKVIQDYSPEAFAGNLWKAADLAMDIPRPTPKVGDRSLLWALGSI